MGVADKLRQRLTILDPIHELSRRIGHKERRYDEIGDVVETVDSVDESKGESREGNDH